MKVFLDANVLFTACYSSFGKSNFIIKNKDAFKIQLITSDYALEEARRNLNAKKSEALIELNLILNFVRVVPSVVGPCPILLPTKEQPIFLTALKENSKYLLTGDIKDFGSYMNDPSKACGIIILTASDFLKSI